MRLRSQIALIYISTSLLITKYVESKGAIDLS